jgi:hypothetical protein
VATLGSPANRLFSACWWGMLLWCTHDVQQPDSCMITVVRQTAAGVTACTVAAAAAVVVRGLLLEKVVACAIQ